jgi:hypothetical protein
VVQAHASVHHPLQPNRRGKPTTFGMLAIDATPNAVVVIDGKTVGFTPLKHLRLPTGRHEVQLRRPWTRAIRWSKIVTVSEHRQHRITLKERAH